jgi:hypothetical protein
VNDEQALEQMLGRPQLDPDVTVDELRAELSGMETACAVLLGIGIVGWVLFFCVVLRSVPHA